MNIIKKSLALTCICSLLVILANGQGNQPDGSSIPGVATQPVFNYPSDYAQGIKVNRVRTFIPMIGVNDPDLIPGLPDAQVNTTTDYSDGFGRTIQIVAKGSGIGGRDAVTVAFYDSNGRKPIQLLDYPAQSTNGDFKRNAFSEQAFFYNNSPLSLAQGDGAYPYSQMVYDDQSLERSVSSYLPGTSNVGRYHGITTGKYLNTTAEHVRQWRFTGVGNAPVSTGEWAEFSLYVTETINEKGKHTRFYKDIEGRTVLVKAEEQTVGLGKDHIGWMCTYFAYDEYGRIRQVITPKAVAAIRQSGWAITPAILDQLCYTYDYDIRGRLTYKKLPGKLADRIIYDNSDRPVLVQNGNLTTANQWLFTKYDALGRVIVTGKFLNPSSLSPAQITIEMAGTSAPSNPFLNLLWTNTNVNPLTTASNISGAELHQLNFYDNYLAAPTGMGYNDALVQTLPLGTYATTSVYQADAIGLSTVTYTRIMSGNQVSNNWQNVVQYYDNRGQVIQSQATNFKGGLDIVSLQYDFNGAPVSMHIVQRNPLADSGELAKVEVWKLYSYDKFGKLLNIQQKVNDEPGWRKISTFTYDQTGDKILRKVLGSSAESQQFKYRIWGALESINKSYCETGNSDAFFGEIISYDYGFVSKDDQSPAGMRWRLKGTSAIQRAYGYSYDDAGRLTGAHYTQKNGLIAGQSWTNRSENYSVANIGYDPNGNITRMQQWGSKAGQLPFLMDDLEYVYKDGGNQLEEVKDNISADFQLGEFTEPATHGTPDYSYDANGNITNDVNKNITTILYTERNKPYEIQFTNNRAIYFSYSSNGTLLSKRVTEQGQSDKVIDYLGGLEYLNNKLTSIGHDEGRIRPVYISNTSGGGWDYEYDYFVKDHQGNVRSVITEAVDSNYWTNTFNQQTRTLEIHPCEGCKPARGGPNDPNVGGGYTMASHIYKVTSELSRAATEEATFDNVASTRDSKPGSTDPNDTKATKLNESEGKIIGPSILIPITAGDKVEIKTSAYYKAEDNGDPGSYASVEQIVNGLIEALSGGGAYGTINEGGVTSEVIQNGISQTAFLNQMQEVKNQQLIDGLKPQAFLNYLMLDNQMQIVSGQSGFLQTKDPDSWNTLEVPEMTPDQTGFLVVFLSNESKLNVHFDDLTVKHWKGKLLEESHYYPYGLTITNKAFVQTPANVQQFLSNRLNRKEFANGKGLEWYDMNARMYDAQIGRWHSSDPLAERALDWSPYRYGFGNPVVYSDPSGLEEGSLGSNADVYTQIDDDLVEYDYRHQYHYSENGYNYYGYNSGSITYYDPDRGYAEDNTPEWNEENEGQTDYSNYGNNPNRSALPLPTLFFGLRVYFIFESQTPLIYKNAVENLSQNPNHFILTYNGGGKAASEKRAYNCYGMVCGSGPQGPFWKEEFPPAMAAEGWRDLGTVTTRCVPRQEQLFQARQLNGMVQGWGAYGGRKMSIGERFIVLPVPEDYEKKPVKAPRSRGVDESAPFGIPGVNPVSPYVRPIPIKWPSVVPNPGLIPAW